MHVWQALKAGCDSILDGDTPLALAILEASNVTQVNGTMELCYDERGYAKTIFI